MGQRHEPSIVNQLLPPLSLIYRPPSCRLLIQNSAFLEFTHAGVYSTERAQKTHCCCAKWASPRPWGHVWIQPNYKDLIHPRLDTGLCFHSGWYAFTSRCHLWGCILAPAPRSPGKCRRTPPLSIQKCSFNCRKPGQLLLSRVFHAYYVNLASFLQSAASQIFNAAYVMRSWCVAMTTFNMWLGVLC